MRRLLILLSLLLALCAGSAFAEGQGTGDLGNSNYQLNVPKAQAAAQAKEYWTRERMDEALANPLDIRLPGPGPQLGASSLLNRNSSQPSKGTEDCEGCSSASPGMLDNQAGAQACPASGYATWTNTCGSVYPMRVVGKLFLTTASGNAVCSASLVNGRMIATAGHCVSDGAGTWYTNIVFIPAYLNGSEPYGRGTVTDGSVKTSWFQNSYYPTDYAFMILDTWMGSSLGWLGVAYNMLYTTQVYAQYGYPAAAPYDGSTLYINTALVGATDSAVGTPATIGIGSPLTGGSSGGPWIIGDSYVNGVTSYGYSNCNYTVYAPYFDATTRGLYEAVYARQ